MGGVPVLCQLCLHFYATIIIIIIIIIIASFFW